MICSNCGSEITDAEVEWVFDENGDQTDGCVHCATVLPEMPEDEKPLDFNEVHRGYRDMAIPDDDET